MVRVSRLVLAFGVLASVVSARTAQADPIYTTVNNSGTPNCTKAGPNTTGVCSSDTEPVASSMSFSINASGQLVVVVKNTTTDPWQDSQNIAGISFLIKNSNGTQVTGTLAETQGQTLSSSPLNTDISGLISGAPSTNLNGTTAAWTQTAPAGNSMNTSAGYTFADVSAAGGRGTNGGPGSIVAPGVPLAGGGIGYTSTGQNCNYTASSSGNCGSSLVFGGTTGTQKVDDPMIYGQATFTFNLTGVTAGENTVVDTSSCASGDLCLSNVEFAYGPDDFDADDVIQGAFCSTCVSGQGSPVPEPSTWMLFSTGLGVATHQFRRRRAKAAR